MYAKGYNRIFGGMIIFIFHINLGYLTILPNCIGYMLIYSGLNILSSQHQIYKKGKVPTIILTILTLSDIWHDPNNIFNLQSYNLHLSMLLIGTVVTVINLCLIYIIFNGIYELCNERGLSEFISSVKTSWNFYLGISLINLFYTSFLINLSSEYKFYYLIILVAQIIANLSIAFIFKRCKVELVT